MTTPTRTVAAAPGEGEPTDRPWLRLAAPARSLRTHPRAVAGSWRSGHDNVGAVPRLR